MIVKDGRVLIPRTCDYVTLGGKGTLQMRLHYKPGDEKIILDYPGGP